MRLKKKRVKLRKGRASKSRTAGTAAKKYILVNEGKGRYKGKPARTEVEYGVGILGMPLPTITIEFETMERGIKTLKVGEYSKVTYRFSDNLVKTYFIVRVG